MSFRKQFCLCLFVYGSAATGQVLYPLRFLEQRLVECMYSLGASFGDSFSTKVLNTGPSLRRREISVDKTIVIRDRPIASGHELLLRPMPFRNLTKSRTVAQEIYADQIRLMRLNLEDYVEFTKDSSIIGEIELKFGQKERPHQRWKIWPLGSGTVIRIQDDFYVVTHQSPNSIEQGKASSSATYFLANFEDKPQRGRISKSVGHRLRFVRNSQFDLDGSIIPSGWIERFGTVRIQLRREPTPMVVVGEWLEARPLVTFPFVKAMNFQSSPNL